MSRNNNSWADRDLLYASSRNDATAVQRALQNGANVNCVGRGSSSTPLMEACAEGHASMVRILLDAGANARWRNDGGGSAMESACCSNERLPIVELLVNHDNGLLEIEDNHGKTPLLRAICKEQFEIARFLLDRGANALVTDADGRTTLMLAYCNRADLEIVRQLLAAGVSVEARDEMGRTALHHAVPFGNVGTIRELIVEHNASMFALDKYGETPFDSIRLYDSLAGERYSLLIECYGNTLAQEHGRLALHAIITAAEYRVHAPKSPLQIHLPLGKLTLQHFRTLLYTVDTELILFRNRNESGMLPIHMACQNKAPVEVPLPIVRFLVEHGGVGTLAARNRDGALPLHVLCESTNPSLRTVQFLIQSYPEAVAVRTHSGQYPYMIAASSAASLSVVYELVRKNPDLDTRP